ncbi:hypothetical protein GCM10010156_49120 [Planobispora rosea]|uniref:Sporulation and cell division protein SsgA n=1 Tax=Planobispora rosea TaxID=35762 RepID=A0A8J3S3F6_PLARO|nr:SsgA family sporulation/cell division regulator [Planobispora rosea]GGS84657.1 hypothetical protein GCM10010156_49120 [Planobispora rosea]GIH86423.1 hypothetical protein Pro02_48310 [Planobispora rosea]
MTAILERLVARSPQGGVYEARAFFDSGDPFAVQLHFRLPSDADDHGGRPEPADPDAAETSWTVWLLARDLLALSLSRHLRALDAPVGDGQISLGPAEDDAYLAVVLYPADPRLRAEVHIRRAELVTFLTRSAHLVAFGAESQYLDFDAMVRALLKESA